MVPWEIRTGGSTWNVQLVWAATRTSGHSPTRMAMSMLLLKPKVSAVSDSSSRNVASATIVSILLTLPFCLLAPALSWTRSVLDRVCPGPGLSWIGSVLDRVCPVSGSFPYTRSTQCSKPTPSKATVPDEIPGQVLKVWAVKLAPFLTSLLSLWFSKKVQPWQWEISCVFRINKTPPNRRGRLSPSFLVGNPPQEHGRHC